MSVHFYTYKGNLYQKIDEITTKHPFTREWVPFVLYMNEQGQLLSMEKSEFYSNFTEVKDNQLACAKFNLNFNSGFDIRP